MKISSPSKSLSEFKRSSTAVIEQLARGGEPVVLTINGEAKLIAASYQRLVDSVDYSEAIKGIRHGLVDVANGHTKPVMDAFAEIRNRHRTPRPKRR